MSYLTTKERKGVGSVLLQSHIIGRCRKCKYVAKNAENDHENVMKRCKSHTYKTGHEVEMTVTSVRLYKKRDADIQ